MSNIYRDFGSFPLGQVRYEVRNFTYQLTWENDILWMARVVHSESTQFDLGHKCVLIWMLTQRRHDLWGSFGSNHSYGELIRQWTGFNKGNAHAREHLSKPWMELPLDARKIAVDFALGTLPNPVPGALDSGTLLTSRTPATLCRARTPGSALVYPPATNKAIGGRAGCNGFYASSSSKSWNGTEIYVIGPSGEHSIVGGGGIPTYENIATKWRQGRGRFALGAPAVFSQVPKLA